MSSYPESKLGIQLNTFVRFLKNTPASDIRSANNDEYWHGNACQGVANGILKVDSILNQRSTVRVAALSRRRFKRVRETRVKSLYNFVKLRVVADLIDEYRKKQSPESAYTRIMDIGFSFLPAKRLLNGFWEKLDYSGVNLHSITHTDVVSIGAIKNTPAGVVQPPAELVLALDVLPELCRTAEALNINLARISDISAGSSLIVISMPQMNYLPGQKLGSIRNLLTLDDSQAWQSTHATHATQLLLDALDRHFIVERTIGIGFLSTLPSVLMRSRLYSDNNLLGKACRYLCDQAFENVLVKNLDLFLTRTFGKVFLFRELCNGVLIVASPRQARISRALI